MGPLPYPPPPYVYQYMFGAPLYSLDGKLAMCCDALRACPVGQVIVAE